MDKSDRSDKNEKPEKPLKIAGNFLYMFEFVVDDLLITRQNLCAPEEYPTCTEITFRSSVYVNLCDREVGTCVNPCSPKCGKCALFTLDSPITDKDVLQVHVYKKKTESCKFLIGLSELKVKPIFDRVKESFDIENPDWEGAMLGHIAQLPKMKGPNSKGLLDNCACYEKLNERHEQWCPTSELSKRLLPLFNLCKMQTGNIVLILRLVCNGPAIVSTFPFSKVCSRNPKCPEPCCGPCGPCPPPPCCGSCPPPPCGPPCPAPCDPCDPCDPCSPCCGGGGTATGGPMEKKGKGACGQPPCRTCKMVDPCAKRVEPPAKCLRYYACNLDKMCPCDYCEDEFDRECPTVPTKRCNMSPIEQKLQKCGPCGGIPPYPRFIQEKLDAVLLGKPDKDKDAKKDKDSKKDKKGKDGKDGKEGKGKKKRQAGGAVYCVGDHIGPSAVYEDCEPACENVLQATRKMRYKEPSGAECHGREEEYDMACDEARKRAVRKLRHLLVKYNIQIEN
ncbi:uncharacterized protein [Drosophila takahashii]|uniref:uncharacterized protein n=1 Tax=Drosophila takahashii TaxID=29030 RepID=UPI003899216F